MRLFHVSHFIYTEAVRTAGDGVVQGGDLLKIDIEVLDTLEDFAVHGSKSPAVVAAQTICVLFVEDVKGLLVQDRIGAEGFDKLGGLTVKDTASLVDHIPDLGWEGSKTLDSNLRVGGHLGLLKTLCLVEGRWSRMP